MIQTFQSAQPICTIATLFVIFMSQSHKARIVFLDYSRFFFYILVRTSCEKTTKLQSGFQLPANVQHFCIFYVPLKTDKTHKTEFFPANWEFLIAHKKARIFFPRKLTISNSPQDPQNLLLLARRTFPAKGKIPAPQLLLCSNLLIKNCIHVTWF